MRKNSKQSLPEAKREVKEVLKNDKLTAEEQEFCLYYSRNNNATTSYMKAYGVTYANANARGYKLLSKEVIKETILRLKTGRIARELLSEDDIFQKCIDIAFADITDYVEITNIPVSIQDPKDKRKKIKFCDTQISIKNADQIDGSIISEISKTKDGVKIKLMDKYKALEWLREYIGADRSKEDDETGVVMIAPMEEDEEDE